MMATDHDSSCIHQSVLCGSLLLSLSEKDLRQTIVYRRQAGARKLISWQINLVFPDEFDAKHFIFFSEPSKKEALQFL